ncbi:unnamed protein product, partial [Gulo gulo]
APGCGACPPNPDRYVCGCAQALVPARRPPDPGFCSPDSSPPRALVPRAEMLLRDLVLRRGCCWPSLLLQCALHPLWGFVQVTHGEPQKSCSKVTDSCQHICQCRPPPLLPPPPPPLL